MKKIITLTLCLLAMAYTKVGAQGLAPDEELVHECDYANQTKYPWYSMYNNGVKDHESEDFVAYEKVEDGCLVIENTATDKANWEVQYFVDDQVPTTIGNDYIVRATIKATGAGTLNCNMGDWSNVASGTINFTDEWQTVDCKVVGVPATPAFVVFQSGSFVGTIYISKVQVIQKKKAGLIEVPATVVKFDYEDGAAPGGWGSDKFTRDVVENESYNGTKCAKISNTEEAAYDYSNQMAISFTESLTNGETYYLRFWAKASTAFTLSAAYQESATYGARGNYPATALTQDWKEYELKTVITGENCDRLCINFGKLVGDVYIDDLEIYTKSEETSITLTIGDMGYSTYCPTAALDFTSADNIAAYKAAVNGSTVNLTRVYKVAAGEGVLLRSLNGGAAEESINAATESVELDETNAFVGLANTGLIVTENMGGENVTNYVLSSGSQGVGFYKAKPTGTLVAAGKAYLPVTASTADGAKGLTLSFDDETTAISEIATGAKAADKVYYNISGQRVANPAKGLYIVNGKKVIVK